VAKFWTHRLGWRLPMARKLLYLVRHGETDWNSAGRWQGHTDIALNERGREQARRVAIVLRGTALAGIVSSDLVRARETAQIIAQQLGMELAYVDPTLRERAFGPFEGLTREECARLHAQAWRAWRQDQVAPPGAEDRPTLAARVAIGLRRAAEEVAREDAGALVVTHGGALRAAVRNALGAEPPPIANGAIWLVEWDEGIVSAVMLAAGD
jgi:broad specificity phosphatase PhoE